MSQQLAHRCPRFLFFGGRRREREIENWRWKGNVKERVKKTLFEVDVAHVRTCIHTLYNNINNQKPKKTCWPWFIFSFGLVVTYTVTLSCMFFIVQFFFLTKHYFYYQKMAFRPSLSCVFNFAFLRTPKKKKMFSMQQFFTLKKLFPTNIEIYNCEQLKVELNSLELNHPTNQKLVKMMYMSRERKASRVFFFF